MGKILGAAAAGGPAGMAIGAAGGLITAAGSLIGGGRRRREERAARAEFDAQRQALMDYSFTNPFAGLENVAEDLTVNQQASQFQAQQTDAALAQSMQAAIASGGAPGGAQAKTHSQSNLLVQVYRLYGNAEFVLVHLQVVSDSSSDYL